MSPPDSGFADAAPTCADSRYAAHAFVDGERCLTIAGLMRRWLAWEWTLWTLACGGLLWHWGVAPGWLLLAAPASWLAARWTLFVIELLFSLTANRLPPRALAGEARAIAAHDAPPVSALALLRCITAEWRHWLFTFVLGQAFARLAPPTRTARASGPVVLLVHGFGCHGGIWRHVVPRLEAEGWQVETIDLLPVFGPIDDYVERIHTAVEQACARHGVERIDAVGHSMGGVALRAYAARHGDDRLARLVTVGSPHRGTWFAHLFISPNVKQMRLGNDFLAGLAAIEATAPRGDRVCIWSNHDNVVTPQVSARLPGARELRARLIGHLSLICEPAGVALIVEALRTGARREAHTGTPSLRLTAM